MRFNKASINSISLALLILINTILQTLLLYVFSVCSISLPNISTLFWSLPVFVRKQIKHWECPHLPSVNSNIRFTAETCHVNIFRYIQETRKYFSLLMYIVFLEATMMRFTLSKYSFWWRLIFGLKHIKVCLSTYLSIVRDPQMKHPFTFNQFTTMRLSHQISRVFMRILNW